MPDFPVPLRRVNRIVISPMTLESLTLDLRGATANPTTSFAWPTANLAIFVPFEVFAPLTILKMAVNNGAAVSGNIDVGIYDYLGNLKVSIGSTAQAGTSAIQIFDITDTLLLPGLYYLAVALDNTTGTLAGWSALTALVVESMGCFQQASAFPLPSPATFAAYAQTVIPLVSAHQKTTL